jgi:hypothetical protein
MIEDVVSVVIARPVGDVFAYVADLDHIPAWVAGARVQRVSAGPFGDNTIFQQDRVRVKVSRYRRNTGFETESLAVAFPANLVVRQTHGALSVEAVGEGTRLTLRHRFEVQPYVAPFAGWLARKAHQESQNAVGKVKRLLEP